MSFFKRPKTKNQAKVKKTKKQDLLWEKDDALQKEMEEIITLLELKHLKKERIFCYRTNGSKAHAYARLWAFPKIFQDVLGIKPAYVMEIISENFDKLSMNERKKVIIHELLHIPKNFSGSLLPHKYGYTRIDDEVENLFRKYMNSK
jgi:predicted metallopeptidase